LLFLKKYLKILLAPISKLLVRVAKGLQQKLTILFEVNYLY